MIYGWRPTPERSIDRPQGLSRLPILVASLVIAMHLAMGCSKQTTDADRVDLVIGRRGLMPGQFVKPRAIAIAPSGEFVVVDMQAMIQWLSPDGEPIAHWQTPTHQFGRPSGLALSRAGELFVADSHYHQVLVYDRQGNILRRYGGDEGEGPLIGRFGYIADVAIDSQGNIYIAEAQQNDRITKVSPSGEPILEWGGLGPDPGMFQRIRALVFDAEDHLYVADACNHRIQIFDTAGTLLDSFGTPGSGLGELSYPYDIALGPDGTIFVCEYGNHRVQRFTRKGESLGVWGRSGRNVGELFNPWALDVDAKGRVYVVDANNHRIQRVLFPDTNAPP